MNTTIKKAVENGTLKLMQDIAGGVAYVGYDDETGKHHETAYTFVRVCGDWEHHNTLFGDLQEALGGEEGEQEALEELGLLDSELVREQTVESIVRELQETEALEAGEAMYYDKETGEVEVGKDGCQKAGTICLRVGPDHVSNLDTEEIRDALVQQIGGE